MLSESELTLIWLLRDIVGSGSVGIGPDTRSLVGRWEGDSEELILAINGLERRGFLRVSKAISQPRPGLPKGLWGMVGVQVTENLQSYCDNHSPL